MNGYRNDYSQGQREFFWTLPRAFGAAFVLIVAVFLLAVAVTPLTIGFGWVTGEANLRSFSHVEQTYREAFDDVNSMDANVRQACRYQELANHAKDSGDNSAYNQRESQLTAVENNFDRIKGEYEAYMGDHFRGGVIRPSQLPMPYPTLDERMQDLCTNSSG